MTLRQSIGNIKHSKRTFVVLLYFFNFFPFLPKFRWFFSKNFQILLQLVKIIIFQYKIKIKPIYRLLKRFYYLKISVFLVSKSFKFPIGTLKKTMKKYPCSRIQPVYQDFSENIDLREPKKWYGINDLLGGHSPQNTAGL